MAKIFKRSPLKSSRLVKRKRRIFWLKVFGVFISLVLIIGITYWISELSTFELNSVEVIGNAAVSKEDLEAIVKEHISGKILWIYPKSNRFLYPENEIQAAILQNIERVEQVEVEAEGLHTVKITIAERAPSFVWCDGTPADKKDCYFLDDKGYVFSEAPVFSGNAYFSFFGLLSGNDPVGKQFLEADRFRDITKFVGFLGLKDVDTFALVAHSNGVYDIHRNQGGKIYIKNSQDMKELEDNVVTIIEHTDIFKPHTDLEYLDLRFGNKIFYKITGDNEVQENVQPEV